MQKPVNHIQNSENNIEMYENIMKLIYHGIYMCYFYSLYVPWMRTKL